jgi:hypothetical protein
MSSFTDGMPRSGRSVIRQRKGAGEQSREGLEELADDDT